MWSRIDLKSELKVIYIEAKMNEAKCVLENRYPGIQNDYEIEEGQSIGELSANERGCEYLIVAGVEKWVEKARPGTPYITIDEYKKMFYVEIIEEIQIDLEEKYGKNFKNQVGNMIQQMVNKNNIEILKKKIDETLKNNNKKEFIKLTEELKKLTKKE